MVELKIRDILKQGYDIQLKVKIDDDGDLIYTACSESQKPFGFNGWAKTVSTRTNFGSGKSLSEALSEVIKEIDYNKKLCTDPLFFKEHFGNIEV